MKRGYIALQMSVGLSVGWLVGRLYIFRMITRHGIDLGWSDLAVMSHSVDDPY